jgi:hypothetical protein
MPDESNLQEKAHIHIALRHNTKIILVGFLCVAPKRFTPFIQEETWYFLYFFKIDIVIANGRPTTITCIFS